MTDMDSMISQHCAATGCAEPEDIEARKKLHLMLLYERLADYIRRTA